MTQIVYTWNCKTVDVYPTYDEFNDVIYNVHWRYKAMDIESNIWAEIIGTQNLSLEDLQPQEFISVESLTNAQVSGWVEQSIGEEEINRMQEALVQTIQSVITPTSITMEIGE
jgi:hypothetical protein